MEVVDSDRLDEKSNLDDILLDHVHAGVCVIREMRFLYVNQRLADMLELGRAGMLGGMDALEIVHPEDRAMVLDKIRRRDAGESVEPYDIRIGGRVGRMLDVRVCGRNIRFAGGVANLVTMTDISEVKQALHAADWRARMLALTEDLCRGASLEIDLLHDRVTVSAGLWTLLGSHLESPVMSRRAALSWIAGSDRAAVVSAWRHALPGRPFELQHRLRRCDGRLAIVHHRGLIEPDPAGGPHRGIVILQDVTAPRDTGRRLQELSSPDRPASSRGNERAMRQVALEWALRQALAGAEFSLLYQPQVELRHGGIQGVEALLRWRSATLGEVSPAEFIPVAEQSGQIVAIGDWVLRNACAQAAAWRREGFGHLRVHVNITAAQLARDDLADRIQAILLESGADPGQLGVEVTESMLAGDSAKAARALGALRAIGIEISLDDFGTGYSNLSTLRALPIDVIKEIDRSFVNDVLAAPAEVSMTRAVITMAHSLQMRVLAEGVESESQLALLLAHRCDAIQGYHFSHPVDAPAISALLRDGQRLPERLFNRPPRQRTLLLVDDEENIVSSLKRSLRRGGYRIVTANSAAEGLQRLAETEVDVIISDQRMPGMTGVEFLRRAKDLYPHTVRIVLSGYTELQSITDAINEGAIYKFLTKPWEDDLLRANIEEAFRQKEMADENRRLDEEVRTANAGLAELNQRLQAALAKQNEELSLVEEGGRNVLEVLYNVPMPLIGFDSEGLIAFANHDAEHLLPGVREWIGTYAEDSLPAAFRDLPLLADGQSLEVTLDGVRCRCSSRAIDDSSGRRGTLVALVPQWESAPP